LPLLSDFLFFRNVLTPLAVVVGLKADGVAQAGNDVGCVYGVNCWSEEASLSSKVSSCN
jgi:hypothetical protein